MSLRPFNSKPIHACGEVSDALLHVFELIKSQQVCTILKGSLGRTLFCAYLSVIIVKVQGGSQDIKSNSFLVYVNAWELQIKQ